MDRSPIGQPGPLRRFAAAGSGDIRTAVIGSLVVAGLAGAGAIIRALQWGHRVEMRVWVFAVIVGALLLVFEASGRRSGGRRRS